METFVRRPDRLRVNADGDLVDKQFFSDGKTITLYDEDENVYGTLEVPPNIESALDRASKVLTSLDNFLVTHFRRTENFAIISTKQAAKETL